MYFQSLHCAIIQGALEDSVNITNTPVLIKSIF